MLKISPARSLLIVAVALFIITTANVAFFKHVLQLYPLVENIGFNIALFVLVLALLVFIMSICCFFIPPRILCAVFILIAAISAYFSDTYGVVIDTDMLRNALETNYAETADVFSLALLLRIIFLALLPIVVIYNVPFRRESLYKKIKSYSIMSIGSFAVAIMCVLSSGSQFASFIREHKSVRFYITPSYPIYSIGRYIADRFKIEQSTTLIQLNAKVMKVNHTDRSISFVKPNLVIMVVGETARADHFSVNGYERDTNEFTRQENQLISYSRIQSCGTSTAISVPCMFSYQGRNGFDVDQSRRTENVLDLLKSVGVNVLWRDNNSDSKGMAARVDYQNFRSVTLNQACDEECRDIGMLNGLQDYIGQQRGDILIVLHQMGSHGPAYFKRYPKEFEQYKPACRSAELAQCSQQEIINAYDNSLRYTDYFLSKVIDLLKNNTAQYATTMLYVSDHGESLGEGGMYLHGMPYSFAPAAQTNVPILLWGGQTSPVDFSAMHLIKDEVNSHDAIFDGLLTLFDVRVLLPPSSERPLLVVKGK